MQEQNEDSTRLPVLQSKAEKRYCRDPLSPTSKQIKLTTEKVPQSQLPEKPKDIHYYYFESSPNQVEDCKKVSDRLSNKRHKCFGLNMIEKFTPQLECKDTETYFRVDNLFFLKTEKFKNCYTVEERFPFRRFKNDDIITEYTGQLEYKIDKEDGKEISNYLTEKELQRLFYFIERKYITFKYAHNVNRKTDTSILIIIIHFRDEQQLNAFREKLTTMVNNFSLCLGQNGRILLPNGKIHLYRKTYKWIIQDPIISREYIEDTKIY